MSAGTGAERRRFERIDRSLVTYYRKIGEGDVGESVLDRAAVTRNISMGGVLVELDESLRVGDRLAIEILLSGGESPVSVVGHIVRRVSTAFGIEFDEMSLEDRKRFEKYLVERKSPGGH